MKLLLINNSVDTFTYAISGVVVQPNSTLDVSSLYWFGLITDHTFIRDIRMNNLQVGDGIKTYSTTDAENYLKFLNDTNNYNNRDTDGAQITRNKAAKKGWSFWAVAVEITTSTLGGTMFCQDSTGTAIPGVTCKIYDANNNEITTAGVLNANLNQCVKTVIDFEPAFDYEIIGGNLRINANQSNDARLWIVGAPDIPVNMGGSKEFASGINLKFLAPDASFDVDGRVTKFLTYDANLHTSKMRMIIKHPAGSQINMQLVIHIHRQ
jgi:hypothetical protein